MGGAAPASPGPVASQVGLSTHGGVHAWCMLDHAGFVNSPAAVACGWASVGCSAWRNAAVNCWQHGSDLHHDCRSEGTYGT
jgi:hypothetical protein